MSDDSLTVIRWTEQQFFDSEAEWQDLLNRSSCDKLFLSWIWVSSWWQIFCRPSDSELMILAAYNDRDDLVGVAPLYSTKIMRGKVLPSRVVTLIGNSLTDDGMFSEYLDLIVDEEVGMQAKRSLIQRLIDNRDWDELLLANVPDDISDRNVLEKIANERGCRVRYIDSMQTFQIDLKTAFEEYLGGLSGSARRRLFNRRKALVKLGTVAFESSSNAPVEEDLEAINSLKSERWGQELFDDRWIQFNTKVAESYQTTGQLRISKVLLDSKPVSYLYNIRAGEKEYNLQSAFDTCVPVSIGLGNLHLGYSIEASSVEGDTCYDLLAGSGRSTDYKAQFATETGAIHTAHLVRSRVLKTLLWLRELLGPQKKAAG